MNNLRTKALIGLLVAGALYLAWDKLTPTPPPVGQWTEAPVSKPVADVPKVEITPKKLNVYAPQAKKKLKLPDAVQQDDNMYVLSSTTLKPSLHPQTVTTVANAETGETSTIYRREAYPLFAARHSGEIRIDYGVKRGLERVGRLTVREDVAQIKGVNLGATASVDTDRDFFAGIGVGYKW